MRLFVLFGFLVTSLSGCYRISPDEDELNTVPVTNNPHFVPKKRGFGS